MRLDRDWIERHIPHQGSMCLHDAVLHWDATRIECSSGTHRAPDNPLRHAGRLGAACGIEYAAQSMAIHGALTAPASVRALPAAPALLASVRGVTLHVAWLDDVASDLVTSAERIAGDHRSVQYGFTVAGDGRVLLSGRATIVFDFAAAAASEGLE